MRTQTSVFDADPHSGNFIAFIMAFGSIFAAMNTMYAAVRRGEQIREAGAGDLDLVGRGCLLVAELRAAGAAVGLSGECCCISGYN